MQRTVFPRSTGFVFHANRALIGGSARGVEHRAGLLVLMAMLLACCGCAATYLSNRDRRDNPLSLRLGLIGRHDPRVSERTWRTLRRFDLEEYYLANSDKCFDRIRQRVNNHPDGDLIYALSELSYVEGKKAAKQGRSADALKYFGVALTNSYDYLFSDDLDSMRNEYDPQFRAVVDLYNESLEDTLRMLIRDNHIEPGQSYTINTADRKFVVRTALRGQWDADEFDHYEFVSDYEIETLRNRHTTYGLGVPLIAVRRAPNDASQDSREQYYPKELSYPVTALMRCIDPTDGSRAGEADTCVLELFDPLTVNQIELSSNWVPLETDLTTPLAFFLDSPESRKRNQATEGLLVSNESQAMRGLFMLEPYDPERIPVLMVHGLWSSPMTWMDMFNDLRSFPEIRERYQFWFYLYPSGQPFWNSATQLRDDLAVMRNAFDPGHRDRSLDQMVLVGHSMGGLVSRLQTIESGDDFWHIISDKPARDATEALTHLKGPDEDRLKLVSTLFFKPNQSVRRVITIGTPHRGSDFANDFTRWVARLFIKLPEMTIKLSNRLVAENPQLFRDTELLTMSNAIDSLAAESPIFTVMMRAQPSPGVKYHNIIGVRAKSSLWRRGKPGDGIVEYESAKMDDVESELIVDAEHTSIHMIPKTIFEVRRILLEHLKEVDAGDRVAASTEERIAARDEDADPGTRKPVVIER